VRFAFCALVLGATAAPCASAETLRSLAERHDLTIGVMGLDPTWNTPAQRALVAAEFNAVTAGAYWTRVRPARDQFDWSATDAFVAWAQDEQLAVHLHPLLYPADDKNPAWVLASDPSDAREMLAEHIAAAMGRYRGVARVWDVVNEAVAPTGAGGYRDSWWLRAMGPAYIVEAFRLARAHDPSAILVYNDHDIELSSAYHAGKWNTVKQILTTLHSEGLVDGMGWELHTNPDEVLGNQFVLGERMAWVEQLGLKNFVTELDVEIGPGDEALELQRQAYQRIASTWLAHHGGGWFQTWGVYDRHTWLGSDKRPLLFDESYAPKPAYFGVAAALEAATSADFTGDGVVDGADFLEWQRGVGTYDSTDLLSWRRQIARLQPPVGGLSGLHVPEPGAPALAAAATLAAVSFRALPTAHRRRRVGRSPRALPPVSPPAPRRPV
jgi:endo-1,4-beta-xylanase